MLCYLLIDLLNKLQKMELSQSSDENNKKWAICNMKFLKKWQD